MAGSEIDDIFAGIGKKGRSQAGGGAAAVSVVEKADSVDIPDRVVEKKNRKKRKREGKAKSQPGEGGIEADVEGNPPSKKTPTSKADSRTTQPEKDEAKVVFDPSSQPKSTPQPRTAATSHLKARPRFVKAADRQKEKDKKQDEEMFRDSRGTSSARRKTDEGWSIYKEDELGLTNSGGDTPLCPFDCECCF